MGGRGYCGGTGSVLPRAGSVGLLPRPLRNWEFAMVELSVFGAVPATSFPFVGTALAAVLGCRQGLEVGLPILMESELLSLL